MKKIIVIIPAFNEEETIHETVCNIKKIKKQASDINFKLLIYVINDGSEDKTAMKAQDAGADRILHHRVNQGLGSAVRTGLQAAKREDADIVVKFDADLQHDPEDILTLIRPILKDEAEIVYGNRFEMINYRMPFIRKAGNIVFTKLMRWLTKWPVVDSQPGIFAISKEYLKVSYIPGDYNYTQQILLDAYHKGMRFTQVPTNFYQRASGKSFVSLRYPFKVLPQILQVLVGVKPLKVFGPIALFFWAIGFVVFIFNFYAWASGNAEKPIQQVNLVLGTGFFGLQTLFFGLLADLIVKQNTNRRNYPDD